MGHIGPGAYGDDVGAFADVGHWGSTRPQRGVNNQGDALPTREKDGNKTRLAVFLPWTPGESAENLPRICRGRFGGRLVRWQKIKSAAVLFLYGGSRFSLNLPPPVWWEGSVDPSSAC